MRDLLKPLFIDFWFVEAPKNALIMFIQETEDKTVIVVL